MPLYTDSSKGVFDGLTEITLTRTPATGITIVTMLRIVNTDTANITPKVRIYDAARYGDAEEYLRISNDITLETDEYMQYEGVVCVLNPGQVLVAELSAAVTTNEPEWMVVWAREVY